MLAHRRKKLASWVEVWASLDSGTHARCISTLLHQKFLHSCIPETQTDATHTCLRNVTLASWVAGLGFLNKKTW